MALLQYSRGHRNLSAAVLDFRTIFSLTLIYLKFLYRLYQVLLSSVHLKIYERHTTDKKWTDTKNKGKRSVPLVIEHL